MEYCFQQMLLHCFLAIRFCKPKSSAVYSKEPQELYLLTAVNLQGRFKIRLKRSISMYWRRLIWVQKSVDCIDRMNMNYRLEVCVKLSLYTHLRAHETRHDLVC